MRSIARALTLATLFGAAVSTAADERPIVLVNFVFHKNTCSRYGPTRNAEAERFAQLVASSFGSEFQFAVWRTDATLVPGEKAETTLTVQFRAQDVKSGLKRGIAYYVDYFRDVDMYGSRNPDRNMSSYIGKKDPLYEWDSFARPCGEDPEFTNLLRTRIVEDIHVFRDAWVANFLRYVPIAKDVPGVDDDHDQAVTLALHWKPMHTGEKSEIELDVGGEVKAFLQPIAIHDVKHDDPVICARIVSLKDAAIVTPAVIQKLLESYKANPYVRLFLTVYELNRDTHNFHPVIQQHP